MRLMLLCVLFVSGCVCLSFLPAGECSTSKYVDESKATSANTHYVPVKFSMRTPTGIRVDTSGVDLDFVSLAEYLDEQTTLLELCLGQKIPHCAIQVKIAHDAKVQESGPNAGQMYFPCSFATGKCAGVNQYPAIIVVPKTALAYRHELIHYVTRARCSSDSSGPPDPVFARCDGQ